MENASKALLMAGGMLLAMMILVLLVYAATSMSNFAKSQDEKFSAQQIQEFNDAYLAYNKKRMYGTDVLTVFNKAEAEDDYDIEIIVVDENNDSILVENNQSFKVSIFECVDGEIDYDNTTGRISKMVFRRIEI